MSDISWINFQSKISSNTRNHLYFLTKWRIINNPVAFSIRNISEIQKTCIRSIYEAHKRHFINSIHNHLNLPKNKSVAMFESVIESMKKTLSDGVDVLISGFGKFSVNEISERRGRNPQAGEDLMPGSRRVVTYRSSGIFKDKING